MERPLQIAFKNVESSASLETLIRERVERLQRFHPHITGARVVVEVPHRSPESGKLPLGIAVEIDVPGRNTAETRVAVRSPIGDSRHSVIETMQSLSSGGPTRAANDARGSPVQSTSAGW